MTYLARARKCDLLTLVDELSLTVPQNPKINSLVKLIVDSEDYDEETTKILLENIVSERELQNEKEKAERELQIEREKAEREYQLKKLELEVASRAGRSETESTTNGSGNDLLKLLNRYDGTGDISTFLALFEKQISRTSIPKESWTAYLLSLLPLDVVNLVTREPDETVNNYDAVKQLILHRFKLSAEQFRIQFFTHKKDPSSTWRDFAFELNNYFVGWTEGLKVTTFDEVRQLIIINEIRRKLPNEIREHYFEELTKIKRVDDLVRKFDEYESAKLTLRKDFNVTEKNEIVPKNRNFKEFENRRRPQFPAHAKNENIKCYNCNESGHKSSECRNKLLGLRCFKCNNFGHKANNCNKDVCGVKSHNNGNKIKKKVIIMDCEIEFLLDSGSEISIVSESVYEKLNKPKLLNDGIALNGVTGNDISPLGYFYSDMVIDGYNVRSKIYVLAELCENAILGMCDLQKFNVTIDETGLRILGRRHSVSVGIIRIARSPAATKNRRRTEVEFGGRPTQEKIKKSAVPTSDQGIRCESEKGERPTQERINKSGAFYERARCEKGEALHPPKLCDLDVGILLSGGLKTERCNLISGYKPQESRDTERKMNIMKLPEENYRQFNKRRRKAQTYALNKITQELC